MKWISQLASRAARDERGITGLETAIILIAFVVVATVFAFVVLTTGIFSSERGKETVFAGLQKARGTLEVRGGVVVTATGSPLVVDDMQFAVATTAGGESVPMDPAATNNRTVLAYRDNAVVDHDVTYAVTNIIGDSDTLLESGELKVITLDVNGDDDQDGDTVAGPASIGGSPTIDANERWTIEVETPVGAVVDITRQMPAELAAVMQLH